MASEETVINYAMYVIGTVESNCDWTCVYREDPITIGIMQWYGWHASRLINRCKEYDDAGWQTFSAAAPTLAQASQADHDWNWWTSYYISDAETVAWVAWASTDINHQAQTSLWSDDCKDYIATMLKNGCSLDYPQVLIYAICMYHQSPAQAGKVLASCGGTATLANMHATCLNDSILGKYKNRYNTAYNLLNEWDGESDPPDFGQVTDADTGGQTESITQGDSPISRIVLSNNNILIAYGTDQYTDGITFYKSAPNTWLPCVSKEGVTNPGGNTGGGTSTGNEAIDEIIEWLTSHVEAFAYSQGSGRLSPETSGYTDCSALMWYVFQKITGQEIGTWTGEQIEHGTLIAEGSGTLPDEIQAGDLVFFNWYNYNATYDHVEMYIGNNRLIGHGGPDNGPTIKEDANAYATTSRCYGWMVRRYL